MPRHQMHKLLISNAVENVDVQAALREVALHLPPPQALPMLQESNRVGSEKRGRKSVRVEDDLMASLTVGTADATPTSGPLEPLCSRVPQP